MVKHTLQFTTIIGALNNTIFWDMASFCIARSHIYTGSHPPSKSSVPRTHRSSTNYARNRPDHEHSGLNLRDLNQSDHWN